MGDVPECRCPEPSEASGEGRKSCPVNPDSLPRPTYPEVAGTDELA